MNVAVGIGGRGRRPLFCLITVISISLFLSTGIHNHESSIVTFPSSLPLSEQNHPLLVLQKLPVKISRPFSGTEV